MVMAHRISAAAAACYLILKVSQRRMTRMPFPEIKTTCHDMNGCSVSNKVRAVFGITQALGLRGPYDMMRAL
jgi:hypothetical protein